MKAYQIDTDDGYSTVVFAETRGKARSIAMHTDTCDGAEFVSINPRRAPRFDKYYRGFPEMNWSNPNDRIALVKEGWECLREIECDYKNCPAKEFCERGMAEEVSERRW